MLYGCRLNRFTRVSASAHWMCRLIPSSRLPLPGKPEGFVRIRHKTVPRKGDLIEPPKGGTADPACGLFLSSYPLNGIGTQKDVLWLMISR